MLLNPSYPVWTDYLEHSNIKTVKGKVEELSSK